ncbi:ATP-binding protein [Streptomyces sp. NPDC087420]|uniref:ATP-binding protein n=1 Tax=Streptomyces sp. NPDC087420 TaxID=3365785 RepID=UPI003837E49A
MSECQFSIARKSWDLPFLAEAEELAALRRVVELHLRRWGLPELAGPANLCVTELVTNVITHVGPGTPTTLSVSMNGVHLRLEVTDPDSRALPTLIEASGDAEGGRGMALVNAVTDRWGVILRGDTKVTWCELPTSLRSPTDHAEGPRVAKAEALLALFSFGDIGRPSRSGPLSVSVAEETVIELITDLLHWLRSHGSDPDEVLDRAQTRFENTLCRMTCSRSSVGAEGA